jgi:hypothetical protein
VCGVIVTCGVVWNCKFSVVIVTCGVVGNCKMSGVIVKCGVVGIVNGVVLR